MTTTFEQATHRYPVEITSALDALQLHFSSQNSVLVNLPPWNENFKELFTNQYAEMSEGQILLTVVPNHFLYSEVEAKTRQYILSKGNILAIIHYWPTERNTILREPAILMVLEKSRNPTTTLLMLLSSKIVEDYRNRNGLVIEKPAMKKRWDYHYHNPKNKEYMVNLENKNLCTIRQLSDQVFLGVPSKTILQYDNDSESSSIALVRAIDLFQDDFTPDAMKSVHGLPSSLLGKYALISGDILLPRIISMARLHENRVPVVFVDDKLAGSIPGDSILVIRSKNNDYLQSYLQSADGQKILLQQLYHNRQGTLGGLTCITLSMLADVKIPIIPYGPLNDLGNRTISKADYQSLISTIERLKAVQNQGKSELAIELATFIHDRFDALHQSLERLHSKVDSIQEQLQLLQKTFVETKQLSTRSEDDKLVILQQMLSAELQRISKQAQESIDNYQASIQIWLEKWDLLEDTSKELIKQAEYLFDQLAKPSCVDFSPFIIQYCRGLENEMLSKLFCSYQKHLESTGIDLRNLTEADLKTNNTNRFAKSVRNQTTKYTLGDMGFIISLMKPSGNTFQNSILLQSFREYLTQYYEDRLFEQSFLNLLQTITEDYRNKSAHPNLIGQETAVEFHKLIKVIFTEFMDLRRR